MVKLGEMKSLLQGIGPVSFEALAASDVAAMDERLRQVGEENPRDSSFHEGKNRRIHLL